MSRDNAHRDWSNYNREGAQGDVRHWSPEQPQDDSQLQMQFRDYNMLKALEQLQQENPALVQKIIDGSRDAGQALAQHNAKKADRLQQAAGAKGDIRKRKGWDSMAINRSVRALLDQK